MAIDIIVTPNPGTVDIVEVTTGLKGDRGLRGLGIKDAVLQKDGHFVVTYEDGTTKDTGLTAFAETSQYAAAAKTSADASQKSAEASASSAQESSTSAAASAKSAESASASATRAKTSEDNAKKSETTVINKVNEVTANSTLSKAWAVSEESPDGEEDVKSETGKTQSSRTWALLAKTKAGEASSSAANANNSVTEATNQAKIASTKATESNDSAVASAESAAAAKASETNAKAYETESSKNASSASTSAGKAKTSETNAANSESNALQYKTNAEESKTAAAASASNASKSEVNAKASMNSAATSATSASTSATNAATSESHAATSETNAKQALAESQKIQKEVESALKKVTGFAKYAGSVDNYSDLPVSGNNVGDVWNIVNADATHQIKAGDNVIWNGKAWDNLSGFVDLSNYPTNEDVAKAVIDTTYSGGTITFIHKDGTKSTATIGDTSHAIQADQDGDGNVITLTYYKATDAAIVHQSFQNQINSKQDKLIFDESPTADSNNPVKSKGIKTAIATAVSTAKTEVEGKIPKVDESLSSTSENPVQNKVIKTALDGKLSLTGGTVTGNVTASAFKTGTDASNYFQCMKFRGEGDANTYYHAIDFGYKTHDQVDFHEYGGIWNFYQNTTGEADGGSLVGSIQPDGWHGNVIGNVTGNASSATKATEDGNGSVIANTYYKATNANIMHKNLQNQINEKQDTLTFDSTPTANSHNPVTSDGIRKAIDEKTAGLENKVDSSTLSDYATKAYVDDSFITIFDNLPPIPVPPNVKDGSSYIVFKYDSYVGFSTISGVIGPYVKNEIKSAIAAIADYDDTKF